MTYFGTRLSENISRREPEGYLICLNVPVARMGSQDYLPSELGLNEPDTRLIPVYRPEEEVFSDACRASFEGMPVTDDHPSSSEGVTMENIRRLQCGHASNIRRGTGEDSDLLLADLIITSPALIEEILNGKREISCGYTYSLCEEDGKFIQREIRGNHIAVVDNGRAGPRVSIQDHQFERRKLMKKKSLWRAKLMARMAKDGDVDGLAEIITEMMEEEPAVAAAPLAAMPAADPMVEAVMSAVEENLEPAVTVPTAVPVTPVVAEVPEAPVVVETPADQLVIVDCGPEILEALRQIITLLSGAASDCNTDPARDDNPSATEEAIVETVVEETAENIAEAAVEAIAEAMDPEGGLDDDPVEELVAEILESDEDSDEDPAGEDADEILSHILEPVEDEDGEDPEENTSAADALRATLATFRPMLRKMTPRERQRFNADVAAKMKKLTRKQAASGKPNAYAALRRPASRDQNPQSLGQKIMASRNANLRK